MCPQLRLYLQQKTRRCVLWWVRSGISKGRAAFMFKGQAFLEEIILLSPWTWQQYVPSKRREPLSQQHSVTTQNTWVLSNTAVRTSNLTFDLFMFPFIGFISTYLTPLFISSASLFPLTLSLALVSVFQLFLHLVLSSRMNTRIASWVGRDSSVSIATRCGLDGPGIESRCGRDFPHPSRPAMGPTQRLVQWVPGLFPGGKAAGAWSWPPTLI
jgi:hypothetical protein